MGPTFFVLHIRVFRSLVVIVHDTMYVCTCCRWSKLFRSLAKKRAQRVTRDRQTDRQTDRPSAIHTHTQTPDYTHTYTPPAFLPSFLPSLLITFLTLLSPSSLTPSSSLPSLCLSCPFAVHRRENPAFPFSCSADRQTVPFFFSRYWARQLGNRRHFRTVPAQPTHVCPHISSTHPPTLFFSPHYNPPLLLHTLLLSAHSCGFFSFTFSLL